MAKRVRKAHVIKRLETAGYGQADTLVKKWGICHGIIRDGWFVADTTSYHGWRMVGYTLQDVIDELDRFLSV